MPSNSKHPLFGKRGGSAPSNDGAGTGGETTTTVVKLTKEPEMRMRDGRTIVHLYTDGGRFVIYGKEDERDVAALTAHYARKGSKLRIESQPEPGHDGWRRVLSATNV